MRKIYKSLLMFLFAVLGSVGLNAQVSYYTIDGDYVTTVAPETDYTFKNAIVASSDAYVTGTSVTSLLTVNNAYQFEEIGNDEDGNIVYRLKKTSTGEYLEDPDISAGTISMTTVPGRAFKFTIMEAVVHDSEDAEYIETVDKRSYVYSTTVEGAVPVVLCNTNYANSSYAWLTGTSSGGFSWTQTAANTSWLIYAIVEGSAYDNLYNVLQAYFNNKTPSDIFSPGTGVGNVSQELFDAVQSAYDAAIAILEEAEATDEQLQEVADNLYAAYQAAADGIISVSPGYYIIRNGASDRGNGDALVYDNGSALYWVEYAYDGSTAFVADYANCIWEMIKVPGTGGGFYIRNYKTGRYMGSQATTGVAVPTTEEAEQVWYLKILTGSAFNIYTTDQNTVRPCLHGGSGDPLVVVWGWYATASGWYFQSISQEELDNMVVGDGQDERNSEASELIESAKAALTQGIEVASDATADGDMTNLGLVTDSTCLFSNAMEPTEGDLSYLIDNDQTTYFHSTWSTSASSDRVHNVGADLGKEVQYLQIKYSRRNANSAGTPMTIRIYACNDTTDTANWVEQGLYTFSYTYASTTYSSEIASFTGLTSVALDAPYRFIRLDVEHTLNDATTNSNLYFVFSELRFYEGTYDAENSLIEAVSDEVINELKTQVAAAEAELANELVTETTLAALQAAYDAFEAAYPDVESVNDLYEECQTQLAAAVEGTDLGYFTEGSVATFEAAITAVAANIKTVMTVTEINNCINGLNEALAALMSALIVPSDGDIFRIRSASSSEATGTPSRSFIYAQDTDESQVKWGGYDSETGADEFIETRLNYFWRVIDNGDGTFSLRNVGTGTYLGNPKKNNADVYMSLEPDSISFQSAKVAGMLNIVFADGVYGNLQASSNDMVSWSSASGADNSCFEFVKVTEWEGSYHYDLTQKTQVLTLPIAVQAIAMDGSFYKVYGKTENTIELTQYEEGDEIPAGMPFVYVPLEGVTSSSNDFLPSASSLDELEYTLTPQSNNGLVGVLKSQSVGDGQGLIFNGFVTLSVASDVVAAGSGYFTDAVPTVTESGEVSIPLYGVINNIGKVSVLSNDNVSVYTLSGVKVREGVKAANATSGLPKGLYIVGGSKVLVK